MQARNWALAATTASCLAVFLPGSLVFGFPGVLGPHWQSMFGAGRAEVGKILFYVLAGAGVFMFLTGRLQEKIGPARTVLTGALVTGAAVVWLGRTTSGIGGVYLWAFINGAASTLAYLPGITVAQRWHPARRGLMAGLVSMCFGISGALMAPVFSRLLQVLDYRLLTLACGIAVAAAGLLSSLLIRLPQGGAAAAAPLPGVLSVSALQSLRTRSFWLLWLTYAFVGAAGIAMVTLAVPFGLKNDLTITQAVLILTGFNLTNGLSRLLSGFLSDMLGRKRIMAASFLLAGTAYWVLPWISGLPLLILAAALIGLAFGTLHSVSAPLVSDCYGMANFGSIFGLVFTAFGFVSGVLGPWLSGFVIDATGGNYPLVFYYLGGLLIVSTLMIWLVTPHTECAFQ